jgi:hypothetical protein
VGAQLVAAAQMLFASMGGTSGSIYQTIALLLPDACRPLLSWTAHTFPDARFTAIQQARATISSASMQLVQQFRQRQQQQGDLDTVSNAETGDKSAASAGGGGSRLQRSSGAISPGSFLGLLLSARGGAEGHALSDLQMIMQVRASRADLAVCCFPCSVICCMPGLCCMAGLCSALCLAARA